MDIGKAFSYPFEDEQWVSSILICGLLMFVPIIGWLAIAGYALEAARNVAMGSPRPLPKWDNFGEKLRLGWNWLLISLGYSLPLIAISVLFACIPIMGGVVGGEEGAAAASLLFFCLFPLIFVLALAIQPLLLAATVRYLQTDSLGAAFQVSEIIAMVRADLGGWVVLWLLYLLASLVAQSGSIIVIGILFTLPYGQAIFGHLLGQKIIQLRAQTPGYAAGYEPPPVY
jgi:hypothetical protein